MCDYYTSSRHSRPATISGPSASSSLRGFCAFSNSKQHAAEVPTLLVGHRVLGLLLEGECIVLCGTLYNAQQMLLSGAALPARGEGRGWRRCLQVMQAWM